MQNKTYQIPFSKTKLEFNLLSGMQADVAVSQPAAPVKDIQAAIQSALVHPLGTPPLRELAKPGDRACIVFTDSTRSTPDHLLVPALLRELELAGVRDEDITLLCGIGMHRPSTQDEKITKLGADIVSHYRVIDNEPQNPDALVDLGVTPGGVPVLLHRSVVETDLLIATGIVEPHQYAGYSGGRKTVAVGAAGEALIAHTHGPAFIDHPATRLGRIEGNPFHEAISEAARHPTFSLHPPPLCVRGDTSLFPRVAKRAREQASVNNVFSKPCAMRRTFNTFSMMPAPMDTLPANSGRLSWQRCLRNQRSSLWEANVPISCGTVR